MQPACLPDPAVAARFDVLDATLVERTGIATLWKVRTRDHAAAALKIYHASDMGNERPGFAFMSALSSAPVVQVYGTHPKAALMEWLDGPSLGDMTRAGQDTAAALELVSVANGLHARTKGLTSLDLPELESWFTALFDLQCGSGLSDENRANIANSQSLARHLVGTQNDIRPLHGDLHHDNIKLGVRGFTAFDAKGVLGERSFELANAFRNPKGAARTVRNPARLRHLAALWSIQFGVAEHRLLQWVAVKCALSIAWRSGPVLAEDKELPLLEMFLAVAKDLPRDSV